MGAFSLTIAMALRRKGVCLLVLLFALAATAFMLCYPGFIDNTQKQLDEAYANIPVKGWILNEGSFAEPEIPGSLWKDFADSGYFSSLSGCNQFPFRLFPKEMLLEESGGSSDAAALLAATQCLLQQEETSPKSSGGQLYVCNRFEACEGLLRIRDKLSWLEGYDESCITGSEHLCILSEDYGYAPGDVVPFLAAPVIDGDELYGLFRLKVVATYPGKITGLNGLLPLATYEELCSVATATHQGLGDGRSWPFSLNQLLFTIQDNSQLEAVKDFLLEQGLSDSGQLGAALDDRILKGTTAPLESNLAFLKGLYGFFFLMIAAIGFFLSFLLARGRKAEYAVMRLLGESRWNVSRKALLEQLLLCGLGVLLGAMAVGLFQRDSFRPGICEANLLCYGAGAALATLLTVRVNVMELLRDKE